MSDSKLQSDSKIDIGCNIINEYSILKEIFFYLLPKDLLSASLVCKNWHSIAQRVLHEFGGPYGYVMDYGKTPEFNRKIIPKVILYFSSSHTCGLGDLLNPHATVKVGKYTHVQLFLGAEIRKFFDDIIKNYPLRGNFYSIRNKIFFATPIENNVPMDIAFNGTICLGNEQYRKFDSAVVLNDTPGCTIRTYEDLIKHKTKLDEIFPKNIKGLILIGGHRNFSQRSLRKLFSELELLNVPLAGGICTNLREVKNIDCQTEVKELIGITFEGDNVTVHSAVHKLNENLEEFLEKFATRVGPKPKGSTRLAFLFICIDRYGEFYGRVHECRIFQKHFPDACIYGYYSLGEFFLSGQEETVPPKKSKKKNRIKGLYQQCTSYFIVTINKA